MQNINHAVLNYTVAILILFSLNDSQLLSQSPIAAIPQPYLYAPVGARQIAMAGAYTAIANEPGAIFINPAGIALMPDQPTVTTSVSFINLGVSKNSISWAQTIAENIGVGIGFNSIVNPSAPRTIKYSRVPLGDINSMQYTLQASGAYDIGAASFGMSLKYLRDNFVLDQYADGFAIDLGTKFNVLDLFSFGIAINNLASKMYWNDNKQSSERVPYSLRTGIAMEYGLNDETIVSRSTISGEIEEIYIPATKYVLLAIDAVMIENVSAPNIVMGVEVVPHEYIAVRAGMDLYGYDNTFSDSEAKLLPFKHWGLGASFRPPLEELPVVMHIDYTLANDAISLSHNFSLIFLF